MSYLPMLAMITTAPRHRRRAMMDNLWPAMIPTTNLMQRSTIAAAAADNTVRRAERAEVRMAHETTTAVRLAATQPDGKLTDAQLQSLPTLLRVHRFAPDVRQAIDQVAIEWNATFEVALDTVVEEVATLASALINSSGSLPSPVSEDHLKSLAPNLAPLLEKKQYIKDGAFEPIGGVTLPTVRMSPALPSGRSQKDQK